MKEAQRAAKYEQMHTLLNEKQWRQYLALEVQDQGKLYEIAQEAGVSPNTIKRGICELETGDVYRPGKRQRKEGGGRKKSDEADPTLLADLESHMNPQGDPMSLLQWTTKSIAKLKEAVAQQGHHVGETAIRRILHAQGYSLKANKKTLEGGTHPDRDQQFAHIAQESQRGTQEGLPMISVDCKKKELIGNFRNGGREWQAKGEETRVQVYDFLSLADGKAIPYGVYDLVHNSGFVNVGIDHDTAEFAVESIRRWWCQVGKSRFPTAPELLVFADGGGSNAVRNRLWKRELQRLAIETGLRITVCHFPPGTSKWNKIEHHLFSYISINWRATPLVSLETVIELISHTTSKTGLTVTALKDSTLYQTGIQVTDEELASLFLLEDSFHGDWNYSLCPHELPLNHHVISA